MTYAISERMLSMQPSAIREILKMTADPSLISFAAGNPAQEAFPVDEVAQITQDIMNESPIAALQYSLSEGYPLLREELKRFLQDRYSIGSENDDLIVVSGAQQVMDFACKVLCNEGDTIITEAPTFVGALNTFRSYQVNIVGVDMDEDGINIEKLEHALRTQKNVRMIYLIPTFQNPTGRTMSLAKRQACYELAKKYNVPILEDNPYGETRFSGEALPDIKSLDDQGLVIYAGTFSKILSPGLRVGFVMAPHEIISKMVVAKQCNDVHTSILSQMICHRFMTEYDFYAHLDRLKVVYGKKSGIMLEQLDRLLAGKLLYTRPEGGLFVWGELPEGVDMLKFVSTLIEHKLAVVPGNAFMINSADKTQAFRMNFSTPSDEQLVRGVEIMAEVVAKVF